MVHTVLRLQNLIRKIEQREDQLEYLVATAMQYTFLLYYLIRAFRWFPTDILLALQGVMVTGTLGIKLHIARGKCSKLTCLAIAASVQAYAACLLNGSGFGSATNHLCLLGSIALFSQAELTKKQHLRLMERMILILTGVFLLFANRDKYGYMYFSILSSADRPVELNPNTIGVFWLFWLIFVWVYLEKRHTEYRRELEVGACVVALCLIWQTNARISLLSCMLLIVTTVVVEKWDSHRKKWGGVFLAGLLLSLLLTVLYVGMYRSGFLVGETFLGKKIYSGRERVWDAAFGLLEHKFLIGFSNKVRFDISSDTVSSLHNSMLAVLCYFGIIGLVLTAVVLYFAFKNMNNGSHKRQVAGLLAILLLMFAEAMLVEWTLVTPYCLLFLHLGREQGKKKKKKGTRS